MSSTESSAELSIERDIRRLAGSLPSLASAAALSLASLSLSAVAVLPSLLSPAAAALGASAGLASFLSASYETHNDTQ